MLDEQVCDKCQVELPPNAPEGLCPRCLATMGLQLDFQAPTQPSLTGSSSGPRRFGDYELLEEIAHGGMGVVYKSRQISLNRVVAVKMLLFGKATNGEIVKRFHAEAQAIAGLHHPNIVAIHEIGIQEGLHFFSMDYVEGQTLAERARDNPVPPGLAATYLVNIARAVHYAHQQGVLHRDLKPSNVLIDALDQPRVTDFGLAKRLQADSDLTLEGQVLGTPNYMAPEQAAGRRAAMGPATDVYSLGVILYYILTGRPPFLAETVQETLSMVLQAGPVAPRLLTPAIPRDLETICLKCLEKEPRHRYESAGALAADLQRFLRREPVQARPIGPLGKGLRWVERKPAIAILSGLVAVSLVSGGAAVFWAWRNAVAARERADQALATLTEIQRAEEFFTKGDDASGLARLARALRRNPANGLAATRVLSALTRYGLADTKSSWSTSEHSSPPVLYRLSSDGQYCVLASFDDGGASISTALTLPLPVPEWFPALTEAIAEKKVNELDVVEPVPLASFQAIRAQLTRQVGSDVWSRWARWLVTDPIAKTNAPFFSPFAP